MAGVAQHLEHVGEVVLALSVLGAEPAQRRREQPAPEAVDRRVDLVDLELVVGGVAALDDPIEATVVVAHDPAEVDGGLVERGGEDGRGRVVLAVVGGELGEHLRPDEGSVARHDDDVAVGVGVVGEGGEGDAGGIAGPPLDPLLDELDRQLGRDLLVEGLRHPFGAVAHHDDDPLERQRDERVDHVEQHRSAAQRVEDLRGGGTHAGALARCEHHRGQWSISTHREPLRTSRPSRIGGSRQLGGEVSNLDLGLQRTPCCRYTTPDPGLTLPRARCVQADAETARCASGRLPR